MDSSTTGSMEINNDNTLLEQRSSYQEKSHPIEFKDIKIEPYYPELSCLPLGPVIEEEARVPKQNDKPMILLSTPGELRTSVKLEMKIESDNLGICKDEPTDFNSRETGSAVPTKSVDQQEMQNVNMILRPRARNAAALKQLYHDNEDESENDNGSETDNAVESESSHASETDEDESDEHGESEEERGQAAARTPGEPARKRGRPAYLRSKSGHKWSLSAPEQRGGKSEQRLYEPAAKGDAMNAKTPVEAWNVLFSDEILEMIIHHTNEEIVRTIELLREDEVNIAPTIHKAVDIVDLKAVIGLLYYAGLYKMISGKSINWWSIHSMPLFRATMQRNRFTFIFNCLRFDDRSTREQRKANDRFTHIREIWDLFIANCTNNYEPGTNCTIDEQLISFRGRCIFKMYIPSKLDKYGLKILSMNDAVTHYMISAIPYCGTVTDKEDTEAVPSYYVRKLSESIHNTGRNITCDNWFSSYPLFERMKKDYNLTLVGTIKKNKREVPEPFKKVTVVTPNSQFCYLDDKTLVSYNPKKKKIVLVLSSLHQNGIMDEETGKPEIILFYNETKCGTDSFHQKCHQYTTTRKSIRWPIRMFYGMLDQANVNSFILYNLNEKNPVMQRNEFIKELSLELVKPLLVRRLGVPTLRLKLRNLIEDFLRPGDLPEEQDIKLELVDNKMAKPKRCNLCPSSLDRKTSHKCLQCDKPMCKEHVAKICFECAHRCYV